MQDNKQDMQSNKRRFRLPTPLEAAVGALSVSTLSMGVGALGYVNARGDFRKEVDQKFQQAYQKQIDSGSESLDRGKAYEDSKVRDSKKRFVKNSRRLWGASGAISGSILAGIGVSIGTSLLAVGLSNPAIIAIGAAASLVGAAVMGGISMMIGGRSASKGADDYISKAMVSKHNQKGIDLDRVKLEEQEAAKDNE
ncbi:MAG: hypothetical protein MK137_01085, partial [Rickettsiales bacterium]|nr:hypothetical protein [Rickettsiales bacterium]